MSLVLTGDALEMLRTLPDESIQCCVTSPPYWGLRDYGASGQLGLEKTPEEYVAKVVEIFREVKRVLRDDGVLWLNLGDSYWGGKGRSGYELPHEAEERRGRGETFQTGHNIPGYMDMRPSDGKHDTIKPKDLVGIPWMVAFALRADGWYLRSDIIWAKPNPMPESVTDRPTKSHEYIFLLTKSGKYYYDSEAVKLPIADATIVRAGSRNNGGERKDGGDADQQQGLTPTQQDRYYEKIRRRKTAGWDTSTGEGSHGSFHKDGRAQGVEYTETDVLTRNRRTVWHIATQPRKEAHFATFPDEIPEICIKAGTKKGDVVLDPFGGSGTTAQVAKRLGRDFVIIELNPKYVKDLIEPSLENINPLFRTVLSAVKEEAR